MKLQPIGANQTVLTSKVDGCEVKILFSYDTPVAAHVDGAGYIRSEEYYSRTTSKHVNKWIGAGKSYTLPQVEIDNLLREVRTATD